MPNHGDLRVCWFVREFDDVIRLREQNKRQKDPQYKGILLSDIDPAALREWLRQLHSSERPDYRVAAYVYLPVDNLIEAEVVVRALSRHCRALGYHEYGVLQVFDATKSTEDDNAKWSEWRDKDGRTLDGYALAGLRRLARLGELPKWYKEEA